MTTGREIEIDHLRGALMKMLAYAELYLKRWPSSEGDKKAVEDARAVLQRLPGEHLSAVKKENDQLQKYITDELTTTQARTSKLQASVSDLLGVINMFRNANPLIGNHVIHNPQLTQRAIELSTEAIKRAEASHGV